MNPIELVWAYLKWYVRKVAKPRTLQELKEAILAFWTTKLTNQLCNKYKDHVYKVIPAVIKQKGQASGY